MVKLSLTRSNGSVIVAASTATIFFSFFSFSFGYSIMRSCIYAVATAGVALR